jgi:hypothetical protein
MDEKDKWNVLKEEDDDIEIDYEMYNFNKSHCSSIFDN